MVVRWQSTDAASVGEGAVAARRAGIYRGWMRFNHMELTFARGTLTDEFRDEVDAFYGSVFGWKSTDTEIVGQRCHLLLPDPDQFILLAESGKPMSSPGFDHLGLLQDTRREVDDLLEDCKRYREKDDRVQIQEYEDLVYPQLTVHAFYVKYLLPIYFDVQSMERS
jgi:hypothetical protein